VLRLLLLAASLLLLAAVADGAAALRRLAGRSRDGSDDSALRFAGAPRPRALRQRPRSRAPRAARR
jgi:hypothetical protein